MGFLDRFKFLKRESAPQPPNNEYYIYPFAREAGIVVTYETALTFDAVYACVRWLSSMIAMLPWGLFEKVGERKRREVHNDLSWLIEQQPNPEHTTFEFRELLMLWASTWGNGYAEIERNDLTGKPLNLWPIPPDRVTIRRDPPPTRTLWYEVRNDLGPNIRIEARDMYHIRGPGYDGMQGYSIIALAARTIGMGMAMERYGANFFSNGARPSGLLYLEGNADGERIKKLRDDWNAAYSGENSNKTAVVPKGLKWEAVSVPNSDGRLVELDSATIRKICRFFGVPPHKIFDLKDAHFANIESQQIDATTDCLMPWIVRFEGQFSAKCLGRNQQGKLFTKMNTNALLRGDTAARANWYKTMLMSGVFSINDVLELEDRNDIGPLGDDRYMQMQFTTIERISEGENLKNNEPAAEPGDEEARGPDEEAPEETPANEPATQTDNTTEPLTIQIDVEKEGGRQTLTDVHADIVLQPVIESAFAKLVRQERHETKNKARGPAMGREHRIEWVRTFAEQQRKNAVQGFEPVAAAFTNLTGIATDAADWVAAYLGGVPVRVEQAIGRTDPEAWYKSVEQKTVNELVGAAQAFAREKAK